jgi:hypothetical protein
LILGVAFWSWWSFCLTTKNLHGSVVAAAWSVLCEDADFLRSAFSSTGFLIAKDGSENNNIKLAGITDYDFTIN